MPTRDEDGAQGRAPDGLRVADRDGAPDPGISAPGTFRRAPPLSRPLAAAMVGKSEGFGGSGRHPEGPPGSSAPATTGDSMEAKHPTRRALGALAPTALVLSLLVLGLLGTACAGTGGPAPDPAELGAVRAGLIDYNGQRDLSLVNDTYADRNAGRAVSDGTKVTTDEVLVELAKFFGDEGFWDVARPGDPGGPLDKPQDGGLPVALALVYQDDVRSGWLPLRAGISEDEARVLDVLLSNFTALWNSVEGYRAVYNPAGERVFQQPILR